MGDYIKDTLIGKIGIARIYRRVAKIGKAKTLTFGSLYEQ